MRPALITLTSLLLTSALSAQTRRFALDSAGGLRMHSVKAEPATLDGKRGLRLTGVSAPDSEQLAIIDGLEFANGVIEAEIAGAPAPAAGADRQRREIGFERNGGRRPVGRTGNHRPLP